MVVAANPSQEQWDGFVGAVEHAPLLQSWAWGEFQSAVGRPATRWVVRDGDLVVAALQGLTHRYPFGFQSMYVPHGPVVPGLVGPTAWPLLARALQSTARATGMVFVRFEPIDPLPVGLFPVRSVAGIQPSVTHCLDLRSDEATLLAAMHQKTRYNIKLAEKHGVTVDAGGSELVGDFESVLRQTEHRQGVHFFGPAYFRALSTVPALQSGLTFYRARLAGQTLAAILVIRYGDTATYLHGGSSTEGREHMAPHLLQWAAIRAAKAGGCTWYDFRGVASSDADPRHPWAGFSRFKRGFGGVDVAYPGAYDWVRRPVAYAAYRLAQRVRL